MLLSGGVDISRTYCIIRNEVFFFALESWAFKRESDSKVTDRTEKRKKREKERKRKGKESTKRSVNVISGEV